jgi:hypothetical protein
VGTLSFPVCKAGAMRDNSDIIAEVIRRRSPALLLCAGFSIPSKRNLRPIMDATGKTETVVVLESSGPKQPISFRVKDGQRFRMGRQYFANREDTNKRPYLVNRLAGALPRRSFSFSSRPVLLLVCGEITAMQGRTNVHFHPSAPQKLRDAERAERVLILNPTHTRMGNCGTVKAWRRFPSQDGRVYVSASNWDVRSQKPSPTLHSLWHDGNCSKPCFQIQRNSFVYQEWVLPR